MTLTENSIITLEKRYLLKDSDGNIVETPSEMFRRVAKAIASVEKQYGATDDEIRVIEEAFFTMMHDLNFLPNSPTLMNAGTGMGTLSGCFVLNIDDTMRSIMQSATDAVMVEKSGGGVGFSLTDIRPKGNHIATTQGKACGPISVLETLSQCGKMVTQGGKRDGAHMAVMEVFHPDIMEFIRCKEEEGRIHNFNISVGVTNEFMEAVEDGSYICLDWPLDRNIYDVSYVDETNDGRVYIRPMDLFDTIITGAWSNGEPGLVFLDRINQDNTTPALGTIKATNPCFHRDTLIAVADGRQYVSIGQLVDEGQDIPVYCYDGDKVVIRTGRNVRKTREQAELWKVILDDGSSLIATPDHTFIKRDGSEIQLRDLKQDDRLMPFNRYVYSYKGKSNYYGINLNNGTQTQEHRIIAEFNLDRELEPHPIEIVHHVDFNGLNNTWDNLQVMTQSEHDSLHQTGELNVMKGKWWDKLSEEEKDSYRTRMSVATTGEKNGMYGKIHSDITKELIGQTTSDRMTSDMRQHLRNKANEWYDKNGTEYLKGDRKEKEIRECQNKHCIITFRVSILSNRQFCSQHCAAVYLNERGAIGFTNKHHSEDSKESMSIKNKDFSYTSIGQNARKEAGKASARSCAIKVGRLIYERDGDIDTTKWDSYREYAKEQLPKNRFISKDKVLELFNGLETFKDLVLQHNHIVKSVEFYGYDDVYNLTVDDFHNVAIVTNPDSFTKDGVPLQSGVIVRQCGEQPLLSQESCNLGSINLSNLVIDSGFDYESFKQIIRLAVQFLDNVVDANYQPTEGTRYMNEQTRKIGLGVMGFADALTKMNIPYNSDDAVGFAHNIGRILQKMADETSSWLGQKKGNFLAFENSTLNVQNGGDWGYMRNAWRLSIAPTGTLAMIANCSYGIEPLFSLAYTKKNMSAALEGVELQYVNEDLKNRIGITRNILENGENILDYMNNELRHVFVTTEDIIPEWHIQIQAAFQQYVDSGVSKTINLPAVATKDDVYKVYIDTWKLGCKGITVYRKGSRKKEVLVSSIPQEQISTNGTTPVVNNVFKRPEKLFGETTKVATEFGNLYVTLNYDENKRLKEVFASLGKAGSTVHAHLEALCRIISISLQHGVEPKKIGLQLKDIKAGNPVLHNGSFIHSVVDGLGKAILESIGEDHKAISSDFAEACPDCGSKLAFMEGCQTCFFCGYSRCG